MVRKSVNENLIRAVAEAADRDQLLLIGSTNLDAGKGRAFNLSKEAQTALQTGSFNRVQSILLASVAIPANAPTKKGDNMFDKTYMNQLEALGRSMGADPSTWSRN